MGRGGRRLRHSRCTRTTSSAPPMMAEGGAADIVTARGGAFSPICDSMRGGACSLGGSQIHPSKRSTINKITQVVEHACVCVNQNELMKNLLLWSSFKPTTEPTTHPGPPSHLPPLWNLHLQDQLLEALLLSLLWMIYSAKVVG